MTLSNILFDLDGTLTDPKDGIFRCIQFALDQLGKTSPEVDRLDWCIGPPLRDSFSRLLNTGDQYDRSIPKTGSIKIIWAMSTVDDFNTKHTKKGLGTLNLIPEETSVSTSTEISQSEGEATPAFEVVLGFLALFAAISFHRRKMK